MLTKLYWVDGPWAGKLALAARPRGGDWLSDELSNWRENGVNTVFSLLTDEEERELDIVSEKAEARAHDMSFLSFPIADRQVPRSGKQFLQVLDRLDKELSAGKNVVVHCRQGVGRSGLVAACLLMTKGVDPETAVSRLSMARGVSVPETQEQLRWIAYFGASLVAAGRMNCRC